VNRPACCPPIAHAMLIVSPAWYSLPFVGLQDDCDGGWLELRNCDLCMSTISRPAKRLAEHPKSFEQQTETDPREEESR
jgi:hypothetical protein